MKMGIEGSPEEISDFIANNDSQVDKYIEDKTDINFHWFITSVVTFALGTLLLSVDLITNEEVTFVLTIVNIGFLGWMLFCMQIRYESKTATIIVGVLFLIVTFLASGDISIKEAFEIIKSMSNE
ncbi:hypothetical protein [Salinibacter altiplanensis]|uniref:hypothetical protein n=1 Tax=Salinibacter altiplanensis TaxID=1803181 RepID=UPI0013000D8C|nr:hypothetical protein [Salinibacter altiplanensis]